MPRLPMRVVLTDEHGRSIPTAAVGGLADWLQRTAPPKVRGIVNVALVPDARIRALNRKFRGKDAVTDVLSFPSGTSADELAAKIDVGVRPFLGEIVIARGIALRQAAAVGHPLNDELRVLALHGLLHLLGYDHEHDDGRMRRVEARLRRKGGLREGLIERTRDSA